MTPLRGDVWWVELDPARGYEIQKTRPCVVITADGVNRYRNTHIVLALSSTAPKKWPIYVPVPSVGPKSQAIVDQVRAMDKSRFRSRIATVSPADMARIDEALRVVLELD